MELEMLDFLRVKTSVCENDGAAVWPQLRVQPAVGMGPAKAAVGAWPALAWNSEAEFRVRGESFYSIVFPFVTLYMFFQWPSYVLYCVYVTKAKANIFLPFPRRPCSGLTSFIPFPVYVLMSSSI